MTDTERLRQLVVDALNEIDHPNASAEECAALIVEELLASSTESTTRGASVSDPAVTGSTPRCFIVLHTNRGIWYAYPRDMIRLADPSGETSWRISEPSDAGHVYVAGADWLLTTKPVVEMQRGVWTDRGSGVGAAEVLETDRFDDWQPLADPAPDRIWPADGPLFRFGPDAGRAALLSGFA